MLSKTTFDIMLSITMIVVVALTWGGIVLIRRGEDKKRASLMLIAALVLFGNVLLWAWPR